MAALPGLNLSGTPVEVATEDLKPRNQVLDKFSEYRFEVSFTSKVIIKLSSGRAELFGTELALHESYDFSGTKAAIFSWHGCTLEISGEVESEYVAEETPMISYANVHFALENLRDAAQREGVAGPRVLILGPENAGKTSLCKMLTAYAVKSERQPIVMNVDSRQGLLSVPGSFTATTVSSLMDIEEGWGSSSVSGPTEIPIKLPLVYHFGFENVEENAALFKPITTRLAVPVTSRLEEDRSVRSSGIIIDTPGSISHGKGGSYDTILHLVSEFSITVILVLGSERLFNEMNRRCSSNTTENPVAVIKLEKSGGCVDRDADFMKKLRRSQIQTYFAGRAGNALSPITQQVEYSTLTIYKLIDASAAAHAASYLPGMDDEEVSADEAIYEKIEPTMMMQNSLLAVTHASPTENFRAIRESSVLGYVLVVEVDEAKKKVKLLSPVPGRIPQRAMVWTGWPEDVTDLVG